MPKRKAKYIVNTAQNRLNTYRGNTRLRFDSDDEPVIFQKIYADGHKEKRNPRVKTKHPHKSYVDPLYRSASQMGKTISTNWVYTTKGSADRAYKRKSEKQMNDEKFISDMKKKGYLI